MGLDVNGTRFMLYAKRQGVSFLRTAMLGRQEMHLDGPALQMIFKEFGFPANIDRMKSRYAEPLFEMLGAEEVRSFDAADHEGATDLHDFNQPIDEKYKKRFTAVLDGGSLEHIFNFPTAIKNCMEMVGVGGHFLAISPANNFFGHGFYQFSAELFFRIFDKSNGFQTEHVILFDLPANPHKSKWYRVIDPELIRARVTLINTRSTYLLVIAKRIEETPIFAATPQQSDYKAMWKAQKSPKDSEEAGGFSRKPNFLTSTYRRVIGKYRQNFHPYEPKFFQQIGFGE
jgi:hypothetical protein